MLSIALVVSVLEGRLAAAQALTGRVLDTLGRRPVAGAVITGMDSLGATVGRVLSNERGVFVLSPTRPIATIRVIRIGFTPVSSSLANLLARAAATTRDSTVIVILDRIPTQLDATQIVGASSCSDNRGAAAALALWEQARAALTATVVARETNVATAVSMRFTRTISARDDRVLSQTVQQREGMTTQPFKARTDPAEFAVVGYMQPNADGSRVFSGPDADVLLDPTFATTHCFSVVRERAANGAKQIGLAFRPADGQRVPVDVDGHLWFSLTPLALDAVEFTYTGLPETVDTIRAGGQLQFRNVPNGVSFIENWFIRVPITFEVDSHNGAALDRGTGGRIATATRATEQHQRVATYMDFGGRVVSANWTGEYRTARELGSIAGVVTRKETGVPAARVRATLVASGESVYTDALGGFRFEGLLGGRYDVALRDTTYERFTKLAADTVSVAVADGARSTVNATVPVADSALLRLCRDRPKAKVWSMLIGQVRSPAFSPTWSVRASWQAEYNIVDQRAGVGIVAPNVSITPDSLGNYYVCGVVRERPIHLSIWQQNLQLLDTAVVVNDSLIRRVDLNFLTNARPATKPPLRH